MNNDLKLSGNVFFLLGKFSHFFWRKMRGQKKNESFVIFMELAISSFVIFMKLAISRPRHNS
jgi:hypothetical protein